MPIVSDTRQTPRTTLIERFDEVCQLRGFNDRSWSLQAGLSEKYIYVARNRALKNKSYRLPEDGAESLARAAGISPEWLRFGRGTREPPPNAPAPGVRQALIETLARAVAELHAAGDVDGARATAGLLSQLLGPTRPTSEPPMEDTYIRKTG